MHSITISNTIYPCAKASTSHFYSTDKFIYIIFNEHTSSNLIVKFVNKNATNSIEVPVDISTLKKVNNSSNSFFFTIPVISLYDSRFVNEWTLIIYNDLTIETLFQFNIFIIFGKNYLTGKPCLFTETSCGVFIENRA